MTILRTRLYIKRFVDPKLSTATRTKNLLRFLLHFRLSFFFEQLDRLQNQREMHTIKRTITVWQYS
ncbi:hypothetical protein V2J09_014231 [Rumex salicifolius]